MSSSAANITGWQAVERALEAAAVPFGASAGEAWGPADRVFPGAVLLVGLEGEIRFIKAVGSAVLSPESREMTVDTVFDVASLTKALITTTLVMQLVDRGLLDIDRRISAMLQGFGTLGSEQITVRQLLSHSSGYAALYPFHQDLSSGDEIERVSVVGDAAARELVIRKLYSLPLESAPGTAVRYSDIGFILLGHLVEELSGKKRLDRLAAENIFSNLKLRQSGFVDLSKLRRRGLEPVREMIAATAYCPWRKKVLWGEVHDDNAWAMGGVAGHAGLFSTAADVHAIAVELLRCWHGRGRLVSQEVIREFWARQGSPAGTTWALGWDTPSAEKSSAGNYFSETSVGHLAFTGCSLWIDPRRALDVVLLSNRIHPQTSNEKIREFRPLIHDVIMAALGYGR